MPDQPTSGLVQYIPLGGDGFTAPFAAYSITDYFAAGTATGGKVTLTANMDPRFCSLVSYVTFRMIQATPANEVVRVTVAGGQQPLQSNTETVVATGAEFAHSINSCWSPVPIVLPGGNFASEAPRLLGAAPNTDGDFYDLFALIYLFNIRVRETTPMGPLLWARGAT